MLKELATSDVVYQPWYIQYPQLEPAQSYELKSGLIHLLPKFHGFAGEDSHKHLKEFHVPVLFNTWGDMKRMFLNNFFLTSRTVTINILERHYTNTRKDLTSYVPHVHTIRSVSNY
ncbi:hypothetical protein CR513_40018, partial [Mucuna pruriens]